MADIPLYMSEVRLQHFKGAWEPPPVPLSPFTVLIGRNGSGKSTVLEALQWIDTALRYDAIRATDPYRRLKDLIHRRAPERDRWFRLDIIWTLGLDVVHTYGVAVSDRNNRPIITAEDLKSTYKNDKIPHRTSIYTRPDGTRVALSPNEDNSIVGSEAAGSSIMLLHRTNQTISDNILSDLPYTTIPAFWQRAVFLRLTTTALGSEHRGYRQSFEPLLDEAGASLPALLEELGPERRQALSEDLEDLLPEIAGVSLERPLEGGPVHFSLHQQIMGRGKGRRSKVPIPSWMLSEGTRRITAILALLHHPTPPTLLCIEEVENGLDPWVLRGLLRRLQSATERGTQVILTTHSPWLLDDVPPESIVQVRRIDGETVYERFMDRPEIQAFDSRIPAGTRYVQEEG